MNSSKSRKYINASLSRRTFLKGLGVTVTLPMMESLLPVAEAKSLEQRPKRMTVFYSPNGVRMQRYTPAEAGKNYAMTPILKPLEKMRDKFSVISGLAHYQASAFGAPPAGHGRSCPAFLTGAHAKATEGADIYCGISADQVAARHFAQETQLASLELGIEPPSLLGSCDINYSCTYTNTISWKSPTQALPAMVAPSIVFEHLFGDGNKIDENTRQLRLKQRSSILDFIHAEAKRVNRNLGTSDRHKMDQFLESIRDVERRIAKARDTSIQMNLDGLSVPANIPSDYEEHVRIMLDLQMLALQTDMTRVSTFMLGRELSNHAYTNLGIPDGHHALSHHANNPDKIDKLVKINAYHMQLFADYLEKMASIPDGESNLLDNTFVVRGACIGESNDHDHMDLPIILAGGGLEGNRHIAAKKHTPMCNLLLSVLLQMGVPAQSFGDSSEPLAGLIA
ncbi:DUF1552 domain-containing protein [Alteromonas aestuariivivens]|uniref:DUF1552 domain-containing protein n=1 Tax=Alteromonas aestuariivivens TaxID=1938339 RepID=A0A3D8M6S8_9ALTE|nr:DUF1552 domain-containing protein [Alteromonas aestuariivivens]RDV25255.1 DUF1552 domain-containing protein [Alteromonas aestuariivivens]